MKLGLYLFILFIIVSSCEKNEITTPKSECDMQTDKLYGSYLYSSDSTMYNHTIDFIKDTLNEFHTYTYYGLWFPAMSFSGKLVGCELIINEYSNIEIEGPPSPGGHKRYYYDSMSGFGEYYPDQDSIYLFIDFKRTGGFGNQEYNGNLYLNKTN